MLYFSGHPLSQLLGGAAVHPQLIAMTADWDKGCPDKHHRFSGECTVSPIQGLWAWQVGGGVDCRVSCTCQTKSRLKLAKTERSIVFP